MTSITLRPDDSGLQSLKKENAAAPANRELGAVQAIARIQSISEQPPMAPQPAPTAVYTGPERRRGERRQGKQRVILDTRDHRERRRQPQADNGSAADEIKIGIDVYG
ncbi:MAG TPA: hypothetical protein VIR60_03970 [Gammaproteobacteria bacterium]